MLRLLFQDGWWEPLAFCVYIGTWLLTSSVMTALLITLPLALLASLEHGGAR